MKENKEIYFAGVSKRYYTFRFYSLTDELPETSAVYIFTKSGNGSYDPLYIGETDTLKSTISDHEKWVCVSRWFVNALCVHFEEDATVREQIVSDLIERQRPICND
ncbi:hypothetical protein F4212_09480 [Candidatus Poribacteria bacterium]|nr:hypothetical protein [Candidatus Poribacteria bacterium]